MAAIQSEHTMLRRKRAHSGDPTACIQRDCRRSAVVGHWQAATSATATCPAVAGTTCNMPSRHRQERLTGPAVQESTARAAPTGLPRPAPPVTIIGRRCQAARGHPEGALPTRFNLVAAVLPPWQQAEAQRCRNAGTRQQHVAGCCGYHLRLSNLNSNLPLMGQPFGPEV